MYDDGTVKEANRLAFCRLPKLGVHCLPELKTALL